MTKAWATLAAIASQGEHTDVVHCSHIGMKRAYQYRTSAKENTMSKPTDVTVTGIESFFLPVEMRMPLKFGAESVSSVNCLRVAVEVQGRDGNKAVGWGETPLSVTWAWPSVTLSYAERYAAMVKFCGQLAEAWAKKTSTGHPLEIGYQFQTQLLPQELNRFNTDQAGEKMPLLAALIAASAFDIACHDAFGGLHEIDI